ncbi:MAG: hypothetical protein ACOYOT_05770 [Bacteroidales bacterium]
MANKRELKKAIHTVTASLFTECLMFKELIPNTNVDDAEKLLDDILEFQSEFLSRVHGCGAKDDKKLVKAYYTKLSKDVVSEAHTLFDRMNALNK